MKKDYTRMGLRLKESDQKWLKEAAEKDMRSANNFLETLITVLREADETHKPDNFMRFLVDILK